MISFSSCVLLLDTLQSEVTQSITDRQRQNQTQADLLEIIAVFETLNATVAQIDSDGQEGRSMIQQIINNITTQLQTALATAQLQQTRIDELDLFRENSTEATEDHYTRITNLEGNVVLYFPAVDSSSFMSCKPCIR